MIFCFLPRTWKPYFVGSTLKEKNFALKQFAPMGANFFLKTEPIENRGKINSTTAFPVPIQFNSIALRIAKTPYSFSCSECNRVQ